MEPPRPAAGAARRCSAVAPAGGFLSIPCLPPARAPPQMTIDSVKSKLCFHCGTPPSAMRLQLKDERGRALASLDGDDTRKLGYYSPQDGYILHIVDTDPTSLSGAGRWTVGGGWVRGRGGWGRGGGHRQRRRWQQR